MKSLFLGRLLAGLATCLAAGGLVAGSAALGGLIGPGTGRIAGPTQTQARMVDTSAVSSLAPTPDDEQNPAEQARDQLREFTRRSQVEQLELALQERRLAATRAQAEADLARFQADELEFGPDIAGQGDEPGKPTEFDLKSRFEAADREWGRFRIRQDARAREIEVERDQLRIAAAGIDPERAGEVLIGGLWGRTSSSSSLPTEGQARTIRGVVRSVDLAAGTARISVGTLDGAVPGQTFQLRRPSDMPRDSVGRLRITHAEPDQASGQLENLFEGKPPIVGDLAQLYIPPPGPLLSGDDPEARVGTTTVYISTLSFRVPLALGENWRDRIKKVELLVSTDDGKQWKVAGEAEPSSEVSVAYTAPRDGAYLFAIRSHKENGQVYPPLTEAPMAKLQVIVDTTEPVIRVVESSRHGSRVRLRWEIDEPNLARDSPTITQNVLGENSRLAAVASGTGELTWKVDHDGPVSLQIRAEDQAGNTTTLKHIIPPASEFEDQTRSDPFPEPKRGEVATQAEPQPPRKYRDIVVGKITKTDPGGVAVELSLGAEAGVVLGQKFWVKRSDPEQGTKQDKYGDVVIAWVGPDRSIGVLTTQPGSEKPAVGDVAQAYSIDPKEGGSARQPQTIHLKTRRFAVPFQSSPLAARGDIESFHLYISSDQGHFWDYAGTLDPKECLAFTHTVRQDGEYYFAIRGRTSDGILDPSDNQPVVSVLRVVVDTMPPVIQVASVERSGAQVKLRWRIDEKHIDPGSPQLTHVIDDSLKWYAPIETTPGNDGEAVWNVTHNSPLTMSLWAADLAGNESTLTHIIPPRDNLDLNPLPEQQKLPSGAGAEAVGQEPDRMIVGTITRSDPTGEVVEISVGSDNGVYSGQKLKAIRVDAVGMERQAYGEVLVGWVESDRSIGRLTGHRQGVKATVGDRVRGVVPSPVPESDRAETPPPATIEPSHAPTVTSSPEGSEANSELPINYVNNKFIRIPIHIAPDQNDQFTRHQLFVSTDGGKEWSTSESATRNPWFTYKAPRDGEYFFAVRSSLKDDESPPSIKDLRATLRVVVDSTPPDINLTEERHGDRIQLKWEIDEERLSEHSPGISYTVHDGRSRLYGKAKNQRGRTGEVSLEVSSSLPVAIDFHAEDLAGNVRRISRVIQASPVTRGTAVQDPDKHGRPSPPRPASDAIRGNAFSELDNYIELSPLPERPSTP